MTDEKLKELEVDAISITIDLDDKLYVKGKEITKMEMENLE